MFGHSTSSIRINYWSLQHASTGTFLVWPLHIPFFLQVVEDGYEFFARRQLVTLFSAPNYCGDYDNAGGMMTVNEDLMCSFQVCETALYCGQPLFCLVAWSVRHISSEL